MNKALHYREIDDARAVYIRIYDGNVIVHIQVSRTEAKRIIRLYRGWGVKVHQDIATLCPPVHYDTLHV